MSARRASVARDRNARDGARAAALDAGATATDRRHRRAGRDHRRADADAVTLVAYDSFPTDDTPLNDALAEFTADTGIEVEFLIAGDTGTMLSKAALTAGNPEGDVMWGVDNTFLSRALDDGRVRAVRVAGARRDPGRAAAISSRTARRRRSTTATCASTTTSPGSPSTNSSRPTDFDDLLEPAYADLLVVQNPATSSPGLAFLLATIATYGDGLA